MEVRMVVLRSQIDHVELNIAGNYHVKIATTYLLNTPVPCMNSSSVI